MCRIFKKNLSRKHNINFNYTSKCNFLEIQLEKFFCTASIHLYYKSKQFPKIHDRFKWKSKKKTN
jgi:hypothetical protein